MYYHCLIFVCGVWLSAYVLYMSALWAVGSVCMYTTYVCSLSRGCALALHMYDIYLLSFMGATLGVFGLVSLGTWFISSRLPPLFNIFNCIMKQSSKPRLGAGLWIKSGRNVMSSQLVDEAPEAPKLIGSISDL